jgi:hypothetical protein
MPKGLQGFQKGNKIGVGKTIPQWHRDLISLAQKGVSESETTRQKCRERLLGKKEEQSIRWAGDSVGYRGIHHWVNRKLGKPDTCEHCGKSGLKGRQIHWANISGNYLRDTNDWIRLCIKCHGIFDTKPKTKS